MVDATGEGRCASATDGLVKRFGIVGMAMIAGGAEVGAEDTG